MHFLYGPGAYLNLKFISNFYVSRFEFEISFRFFSKSRPKKKAWSRAICMQTKYSRGAITCMSICRFKKSLPIAPGTFKLDTGTRKLMVGHIVTKPEVLLM